MNLNENLEHILSLSAPALVALSLRALHRSRPLFKNELNNEMKLELYEKTTQLLEFIATDYLASKSSNLGMAARYNGGEAQVKSLIDDLSNKCSEINSLISVVRNNDYIESSEADLFVESLECGLCVIKANIAHLSYAPGASSFALQKLNDLRCAKDAALKVLEISGALHSSVSLGTQRDISRISEFIASDFIFQTGHASSLPTISKDFFALRTDYDFEYALQFDLSKELTLELASNLASNPEAIKQLSPRKFEELICGIFKNFGFSVELTKQTHDGGRDIIVVDTSSISKTKYLIECKRCKRVTLNSIRIIHYVVGYEGASKGILVTTASSFSKNIQKHIDCNQWQLDIKIFDDIVKWLRDHEMNRSKHLIP